MTEGVQVHRPGAAGGARRRAAGASPRSGRPASRGRSGTRWAGPCASRCRARRWGSGPRRRAGRDPVEQVVEAHEGRVDRLIPVRVGRMVASPYAFLRGTAGIMAEDFAGLPRTGITPVDLRRRAPGQLRLLRLAGARAGLRPQRLRRGAPRRLGVGPAPAGHQRLGGRPAERLPRARLRRRGAALRRGSTASRSRHLAEQPLLARSFERLDVDRLRRPRPARPLREGDRAGRRAGPGGAPATARCPASPSERDGRRRIVEEPPLITRPGAGARPSSSPRRSTTTCTRCRRTGRGSWAATRLVDIAHKVVGRRLGRAAGVRRAAARAAARTTCVFLQLKQARRSVLARVRARRRGLARAPGPAGGGVPAGAADGQRPAARLDHGRRPASTTCASSGT